VTAFSWSLIAVDCRVRRPRPLSGEAFYAVDVASGKSMMTCWVNSRLLTFTMFPRG
jgi:hypothetical protein